MTASHKKKISKTLPLGSELVVDFLHDEGLRHVFDLSGGMITYLEDAISKKRGMECVPLHHEQAAGFSAEGYARENCNFGVAIATSGPGATNLITPIGSCYFDSIPTMFIVGQVHTDNLKKNDDVRQEGFQETDIVSIVRTITKYAVLIRSPDNLIYELEKAFYIMKSGRTGPVLVDIPINIQRTRIDPNKSKHFFGSKEHREMEKKNRVFSEKLDAKKVSLLQKLLRESRAPIVLVGGGVRLSSTTEELLAFAKNNNLNVVSSLMGLDSYPNGERFAGYIGSNGNRDANIILASADLIIALGTRLDVRQTGGNQKLFNPRAKIVHVDIDKSSINYSIKSDIWFETDLRTFFAGTKKLRTDKKEGWEKFIAAIKKEFARPKVYGGKSVDPNTLVHELSKTASSKTTLIADVGQNQMWCAQSWMVKKGQRILFSGGMGSMGFSLPVAIGASYAGKNRDMIIVSGDGGMQMNIQEFETIVRNRIPLKIFVLNNKSLGMVREFQDLYFNKNYQSTVKGYGNPNFKSVAEAYGLRYFSLKNLKNTTSLKKILSSKDPVFVEVDIDMMAPLQPKVVYGHALDDQAPYLSADKKDFIEKIRSHLYKD